MTTQTTTGTEWVVLASWTEDGEVVCQVMADGFATEQEANDAGADVAYSLGSYFTNEQNGTLEVCTREESGAVVME